jgi:hypothetical protein
MTDRVGRRGAFAVFGVLGALVAVNVPTLGSDPWRFDPPSVDPRGLLGPLVRAADREWDLGVVRSPAVLAGVLVALVAVAGWRLPSWRRSVLAGLCVVVIVLIAAPATLLQIGLRDATAPWFHTNDSTYQIELAGELVLDGRNPYGHDYTGSGLERFYPATNDERPTVEVALTHFAYFPGTALSAAGWRLLPGPLDDYRLLVLLATVGIFLAVLAFDAPFPVRLAVGAALAASPLLVRGAWFGTADAPSLLALVLSFALLTRSRYVAAAGCLAGAVLLKQFALVALPFFAVMLLARRPTRRALNRAAALFAGILLAGFLPFLVADPGALWRDTVSYGAGTYRILGYGLSNLLVNAGVVDRYGDYPFAILAALVWLPVTAWLVVLARRSGGAWEAAAGFAVSMFVLLFIARVFQMSYLVWPLTGIAVAAVLAAAERVPQADAQRPRARGASP